MRGVILISILSCMLFLSSCEISTTVENPYASISEFHKVSIIDYPYEEIDSREVQSIYETYKNENKGLALYRKTLDLFENQQPFTSVMLQQELQIGLLEQVYAKYELRIPEENWYPNVTTFSDLEEACAASILFAEQSMDLYDVWLDHEGLDYPVDNQDLRFLYEKIRNDYERSLIPLFKRCGRGLR